MSLETFPAVSWAFKSSSLAQFLQRGGTHGLSVTGLWHWVAPAPSKGNQQSAGCPSACHCHLPALGQRFGQAPQQHSSANWGMRSE